MTTRYIYGDNIDELLARIDGTTPRWYLTDRQGSVRDVIDNSGASKDAIAYDAFGNILAGETSPTDRGNYAYTGRQLDVESGLQYNRARYYDAVSGRWITQDPLGFDAGDSNLYRYVNNRPTVEVDSSGLQAQAPPVNPGIRFPVYPVNGADGVSRGIQLAIVLPNKLSGKVQVWTGTTAKELATDQVVGSNMIQIRFTADNGAAIPLNKNNVESSLHWLQFIKREFFTNKVLDNKSQFTSVGVNDYIKTNDWFVDSGGPRPWYDSWFAAQLTTDQLAVFDEPGGDFRKILTRVSIQNGDLVANKNGYNKMVDSFETFLVYGNKQICCKVDWTSTWAFANGRWDQGYSDINITPFVPAVNFKGAVPNFAKLNGEAIAQFGKEKKNLIPGVRILRRWVWVPIHTHQLPP